MFEGNGHTGRKAGSNLDMVVKHGGETWRGGGAGDGEGRGGLHGGWKC